MVDLPGSHFLDYTTIVSLVRDYATNKAIDFEES